MKTGKRVLGAGCWVLGLLLVTRHSSLVTDLHAQVPIINASGDCIMGQIPVKADGGWECQTPSGSGIPPGTPGQIPISNGATYLPGDPIVSGPAAEAASPVNNPVWFAGKDGANLIRSIILLAAAPAGTEYGVVTRNIPSGTQPVSGTFWQATQPVSGAFFQATQPVSLAAAPTTPVTGTFWQTTQPISGSVSVSNFPASQAVTGSFYQATQPVSLATAPTTPVTGTFWQTTQPVSGTFWQTTQPISGSIDNASFGATQGTSPWVVIGSVNAAISGSISNTTFGATQGTSPWVVGQATGTNLHAVIDTGSTTAVTQATGTNLHAVIDTGSTTAATQATGTNLHTVVDSGSVNAAISGSISNTTFGATQGTSPWVVGQGTGTNLHTVVDSGSITATQGTGTNLHAVIDTGSTTAVTQATGTNLHAVIDTGSTTAVTQATAANLNATVTWTGGNGCVNPLATLASTSVNTSGTTAVQMVAASGSTKVHICALNVVGVSGTTPTFSLVYGTGTNCGTGQAVLLVAFATTAGVLFPFNGPVAVTPASQAVCYLDTGTTPIQRVTMSYVQQ